MTAPRLIRLVPMGVCHEDIELVEPCEVQPLSEEQIDAIAAQFYPRSHGLEAFARAIEQAHGIGRRMDA